MLLVALIAGTIVAVGIEIIAQILPPHYSPLSQSESDLAVGPYGYLEAINFFLRGTISLAFLYCLTQRIPEISQSRVGQSLLGLSAIGKLIIAFVATDLTTPPQTTHGYIHAFVALASFLLGGLGDLLIARALQGKTGIFPNQKWLVWLTALTLVWAVVVIGTVAVSDKTGVWGLFERIYTVLFLAWPVIVSFKLLTTSDSREAQQTGSSSRQGFSNETLNKEATPLSRT
jgi:hypothetical protein